MSNNTSPSSDIFEYYCDSLVKVPREWVDLDEYPNERGLGVMDEHPRALDTIAPKQREWVVPALRAFDPRYWEPVDRVLPRSLQIVPPPWYSRGSCNRDQSRQRPLLGYDDDGEGGGGSRRTTDPSYRMTEAYLRQLPPDKVQRFYRAESVPEVLIGPENYHAWTDDMCDKLSHCDAWQIIVADLPPVPAHSDFHTRWVQLNRKGWMLIIANVSRRIRRELCASWPWNVHGAWYHLQQMCGSPRALMRRSLKGVGESSMRSASRWRSISTKWRGVFGQLSAIVAGEKITSGCGASLFSLA
ncbi:hypothetical protein NUU61_005028 [Penicillium alfredii]|uniref:Uncharacterized protein n=1 Tax=Penicillium alfredii TaxID=1506179 RepID=A0A9W9K866_9EURO|nr:uncharacterized protein NUU61_005028 [Penicillium alfredii]KAJ5095672.1 hypothetical protein NUU61_005028 [Penicillium alfredii]